MPLPYTEAEARNLERVKSSFDAWREGRGSPFDLLNEAASRTIVGRSDASGTYPTRETFLTEVIGPFNARMGQRLTPSGERLYADGDTVTAQFVAEGVASDREPSFRFSPERQPTTPAATSDARR